MKKIALSVVTTSILVFSGCGTTTDNMFKFDEKVKVEDMYFQDGIILSQKKCVVNSKNFIKVSEANIEKKYLGEDAKTGIIPLFDIEKGLFGKDEIGYETIIRDAHRAEYKTYIKNEIKRGTKIEFTFYKKKVQEINISQFKKAPAKKAPAKKAKNYEEDDINIIERSLHAGIYTYTAISNINDKTISLTARKYYPFLDDQVAVRYDKKTKKVINMKLIKSRVVTDIQRANLNRTEITSFEKQESDRKLEAERAKIKPKKIVKPKPKEQKKEVVAVVKQPQEQVSEPQTNQKNFW